MKYSDIPKLTRAPSYNCHIDWDSLEHWIQRHEEDFTGKDGKGSMQLDPDFQRAHVWDENKQRRYVEYILRGGNSGRELNWNCRGFRKGEVKDNLVLVDGKQRLTAVLKYLNNNLAIFDGHKREDFPEKLRMCDGYFDIKINDLKSRKEILQWYIDMNDGGVAHTNEEIAKVQRLLDKE